MLRSHQLHDQWTIEAVGGSALAEATTSGEAISARVPGCVHLDLMAAGHLQHPDLGDGEAKQAWVGRTDWRYRRTFHPGEIPPVEDPDHRVELVFESIDTVARVLLDGEEVATSRNQFTPVRVPLHHDTAELAVDLAAPVDELDRLVAEHGDRPVNADGTWGVYSYLRKSACAFGWDWGPMCPGAGLLGSVRIESYRIARIASVRPLITSCDEDRATVEVQVDVDRVDADAPLEVTCLLEAPDGRRFEGSVQGTGNTLVVRLETPQPARWWPRGLGDQPLHELRVVLRSGAEDLDEAVRTIGLRSVALDTGKDAEGRRFVVMVNGKRMYCKGANWIPEGLFPGTASPEVIAERVQQAHDAGMNMLRVWGGGLYEQPAFYEACDRLGILVWQDFMFACATYPEEPPYPQLIEAEASHQVARLSHHPSIVLWCGGNENILAWRNWGWKERMPADQTWGRHYFTNLLADVCARLDPSRPYWADSPYSGSIDVDPNDPDRCDRHTWDLKLEDVRNLVPRFASEFGHQAPPLRRTIEEAIGVESLRTETPGAFDAFAVRQRAWGGDKEQYDRFLKEWFRPAETLDERLLQVHLLQARATSLSFEWLRANAPRCSGALIWQLNDAWSGHSWSLIDVAGRLKPAWWAARKACSDHLLTFQPMADGLGVIACNDSRSNLMGDLEVRRLDFEGRVLAGGRFEIDVSPGGRQRVSGDEDLFTPDEPAGEFLLAQLGDLRATWFHARDLELACPKPQFDVHVQSLGEEGGGRIALIARSLLRDVTIDLTRLDPTATVSDNLFTLLPGEQATLDCTGCRGVQEADVLQPGVLGFANFFSKTP
ncbi:MAG: hypothetical protein MK085_06995 [Phycisphaerales bacterium]|nr:hypothetical protein [Phycisphaerales bacterium]